MRKKVCVACVVGLLGATALAGEQVESFDEGQFTNSVIRHEFEFDGCCWDIRLVDGDHALHLEPNTDTITFDLGKGQRVESVRLRIQDFEGGFAGNVPTSSVILFSSQGDFVDLHASDLGVWEALAADVKTPGRISGKPLGDIASIQFQVANEGNSEVPGVGANFDDITLTLARDEPTCEDVKRFKVGCRRGGKIKARLKMKDERFDGTLVAIALDDQVFEVAINGRKAKLNECCFKGDHTVFLVSPAGCDQGGEVTCRP